jgi:hypothetical protein
MYLTLLIIVMFRNREIIRKRTVYIRPATKQLYSTFTGTETGLLRARSSLKTDLPADDFY